jgi:hypothetical protein
MNISRIDNILRWISTATDFDVFKVADMIRNNKFEFKGTLGYCDLNKLLVEAITAYMQGEEYAALCQLHKFIKSFISYEQRNVEYSAQFVAKLATILQGAVQPLTTCENAEIEWQNNVREELGVFYNEQDKFNAYHVFQIKENIGGKYLHLYRYAGDGKNVFGCRNFKIADTIIASTNISDLITSNSEDVWRVTIGMFIEKKVNLSYFVFSFSKNGNVYILTDKLNYTNPDQIDMFRGSASRVSENREAHLDLPYGIIDEIKDRRQNNSTLATTATEITERYMFDIKDYIGWNIYYIIKYTVEHIELGSAEIPSLNTLALTADNVNMNDDSNFSQLHINELNELVTEIYGENSTALVVPTSEILAANNISTELLAAKDIERYSQYLAHKAITIAHNSKKYGFTPKSNNDDFFAYKQKEMDIVANFEKQYKELKELFRNKLYTLLPIIFSGELVDITDIDNPMYCKGFCQEATPRAADLFIGNGYSFNASISGNNICLKDNCQRKISKDQYFRTLHFKRYTEITTLLGISRNQLPSYFRDYLADRYIPYYGNNILDNVKPEFVALSKDYVSQRFSNYLDFSFPFCGMCRKSLFKKYKIADNALVVISSKKGEVIEIKSYK